MGQLLELFRDKLVPVPPDAQLGHRYSREQSPYEVKLADYDEAPATTNDAYVAPPADLTARVTVLQEYAFGMLLNDKLGICGPDMVLHADEVDGLLAGGHPYPYQDPAAQAMYEATGGYIPGEPSTDQGTMWTSLLSFARISGVGGNQGRWIGAANVDTSKLSLVNRGIDEFVVLYGGAQMPITAQGQTIWDVNPGAPAAQQVPGSWGGHWVAVVAYDGEHYLVVSWGKLYLVTVTFWLRYFVPNIGGEGHVAVTLRMASRTGVTPSGLAIGRLVTDLQAA